MTALQQAIAEMNRYTWGHYNPKFQNDTCGVLITAGRTI